MTILNFLIHINILRNVYKWDRDVKNQTFNKARGNLITPTMPSLIVRIEFYYFSFNFFH